MDIIENCLSLTPVPYLSAAFSFFKLIWTTVQQVKASEKQLKVLAYALSHLLKTLDAEYISGRLEPSTTSEPQQQLDLLLGDIAAYVQKQGEQPFLKTLFTKDDRILRIEAYHRQVDVLVNAFQISSLIRIRDWQSRNDDARKEDQDNLNNHLNDLEANQNRLWEAFNANHTNMMAMMASIQRRLEQHSATDQERHFFSYSLQYLSTRSGQHVKLEKWMVTQYEVEFGNRIGVGGFGQVFRGSWKKTEIALKVLKTEGGIMPSEQAIIREINIWVNLKHPNILQFLGANTLDDKPFIVMPFMKNGNVRDYIQAHPECNRAKILHDMSLGLIYLHSEKIVHGDIKALNVLMDDSERAVLCDFGLSRMRADVTSRTTRADPTIVTGSRHWMAPERLIGGSLKRPCDIYAYGMTIYEIYLNEIPLNHISYGEFIDLVVSRDVRPERPDEDEAPHLTDDIWQLAECCWVKNARSRPDATAVCDIVAGILDAARTEQVLMSQKKEPIPSPSRQEPAPPLPSPGPVASPQQPIYGDQAAHGAQQFPIEKSQSIHTTQQLPPPLKSKTSSAKRFRPCLLLRGHSGWVYSATFSKDGRHIISGSSDKTIRIWDVVTGRVILGPLEGHTAEINSVAISPECNFIASGSGDKTIGIWNANSGRLVFPPIEGHTSRVTSVVFSPDSKYIASGSLDSTVRVWDVGTGKAVHKPLQSHTNSVYSVAFSPNGDQILSGSMDKTVKMWDVRTGRVIVEALNGHTSWVRSVAFSPNSRYIASGSDDMTIQIWDTHAGKMVLDPLEGHTGSVTSVSFSPDSKLVASGSYDHTVRIWDVKTGKAVSGPLAGHTSEVYSVSFSADGQHIVSSLKDQTIMVYQRGN